MQQRNSKKCALWVLLGMQVALFAGFYYFMGAKAAWSALAGSGANSAGQVYFLLKMRGPKCVLVPKAALRYFYRSELLKIVLMFAVLAALLSLFSLNVWIVFMTFVVAQCVGSFAPLCVFRNP